jgi:hypothetical protein
MTDIVRQTIHNAEHSIRFFMYAFQMRQALHAPAELLSTVRLLRTDAQVSVPAQNL